MVILLWVTIVWENGVENSGICALMCMTKAVKDDTQSSLKNSFQKSTSACVRGKRRFTISELSEEFPQISRTNLYRIVTDRSLTVPEYRRHHFFVRWRLFEFLGLVGRMRVHPRFRLLFFLCIHELYPSLVTSYDSVKKFVTLFPVALKKRQGWPHSLGFVKVSQLFWYPPCTELMVTQSVRDILLADGI